MRWYNRKWAERITSKGERSRRKGKRSAQIGNWLKMEVSRPKVGVGVLVCRGSRVLVGRRRSSSGHGTFALPGGHLEFGESWEGCAAREVKEETGLSIQNIKFASVVNSIMHNENQPSHYVTIFMHAELFNPIDEPQNLEPDKCDGWEWVDWPNIPRPIFQPLQSLIESNYKLP